MLCTLSSSSSHCTLPWASFVSRPCSSRRGRQTPTCPSRVWCPTTTPSGTDFLGMSDEGGPPSTTSSTLTGWLLTEAMTTERISRRRRFSSIRRKSAAARKVLGLEEPLGLHRVQAAADQADAPHVLHDRSLEEIIAADVGVAVGHRVLQLRKRDAVALQAIRVGLDLVAFDRAAEAGDVDDPRHALELALQRPVLQGLQIVERVDVAPQRRPWARPASSGRFRPWDFPARSAERPPAAGSARTADG